MSRSIAVVGLGYVGLPVAVAFARKFNVTGYDLSETRVQELARGFDRTGEVSEADLTHASGLKVTTNLDDLKGVEDFIVCVPTPIDANKRPDLGPLVTASTDVGRILRPGCLVVFESTVYPGATEEICIPILETESDLKVNEDFWVGYSPERINPGDPHHRFDNTHKVVSGSSAEGLDRAEALYAAVLSAPIHRAPSIKVAEAAKVIENTQRDLNIALVNELAKIFELLDIDTHDVLAAAQTKWNFVPFQPGLVGGHCIGVDPYYLTHRAQQAGFDPSVILAGRTVNDSMASFVARRVNDLIVGTLASERKPRILVLGATFKKNCPDIRNSKVIDLIAELARLGGQISVSDPLVAERDKAAFGSVDWLEINEIMQADSEAVQDLFDAVVMAVAHKQILTRATNARRLLKPAGILYDVTGCLPEGVFDYRL